MGTIRVIQISKKNRKQMLSVVGDEIANNLIEKQSGNYIKEEDNRPWMAITGDILRENYQFSHDLGFAGNPWKVYTERVKKAIPSSSLVPNRAIVIRQDHADQIKSAVPIENAEKYLLTNVGDVLLIQDGRGHKVVSDGVFENLYTIYDRQSPWMYVKPVDTTSEKLLDRVDKDLGIDTKEKPDHSDKVTRTEHNRTERLALEITRENYSVAAALLPQGFTTIKKADVIGYFVVMNDRTMRINNDTGMVDSIGLSNYVIHPDMFHDTFIAAEFAYGDFIKCYREDKS